MSDITTAQLQIAQLQKELEIKKTAQLQIAQLQKELKRKTELCNNLRKYKFQVVELKSQIRTLIHHKNSPPPKIQNLFHFLRVNDYDAYLYLENMLKPISYQNRMETIHKSIRHPKWIDECAYTFHTTMWLKMVRKPANYKCINEPKIVVNIHGVKMDAMPVYSAQLGYVTKLKIDKSKDELKEYLEKLTGRKIPKSWTMGRMYQLLIEYGNSVP